MPWGYQGFIRGRYPSLVQEEAQVRALWGREKGRGGEAYAAETLLSPTLLALEEPADPHWDGLELIAEDPSDSHRELDSQALKSQPSPLGHPFLCVLSPVFFVSVSNKHC